MLRTLPNIAIQVSDCTSAFVDTWFLGNNAFNEVPNLTVSSLGSGLQPPACYWPARPHLVPVPSCGKTLASCSWAEEHHRGSTKLPKLGTGTNEVISGTNQVASTKFYQKSSTKASPQAPSPDTHPTPWAPRPRATRSAPSARRSLTMASTLYSAGKYEI